jgi:hypothetical protein
MVELYLYSSIRLHGIWLNYISEYGHNFTFTFKAVYKKKPICFGFKKWPLISYYKHCVEQFDHLCSLVARVPG